MQDQKNQSNNHDNNDFQEKRFSGVGTEDSNGANKPEVEEYDFEHPDYAFKAEEHKHTWRQEGYSVVCRSCPLEHGTPIGKDKVMVGISEDGLPVLKTRFELGMA